MLVNAEFNIWIGKVLFLNCVVHLCIYFCNTFSLMLRRGLQRQIVCRQNCALCQSRGFHQCHFWFCAVLVSAESDSALCYACVYTLTLRCASSLSVSPPLFFPLNVTSLCPLSLSLLSLTLCLSLPVTLPLCLSLYHSLCLSPSVFPSLWLSPLSPLHPSKMVFM